MRPLIASTKGGADLPLIDRGFYDARIISIAYTGTQPASADGKYKESKKVVMTLELANQFALLDEKVWPRTWGTSETFSYSTRANLTKIIQGIHNHSMTVEQLGQFDLFSLLGSIISVNLMQAQKESGGTKNTIDPATGYMPATGQATEANFFQPLVAYSIEEPSSAQEFWNLPTWVRNQCRESIEGRQIDWPSEEAAPERVPPAQIQTEAFQRVAVRPLEASATPAPQGAAPAPQGAAAPAPAGAANAPQPLPQQPQGAAPQVPAAAPPQRQHPAPGMTDINSAAPTAPAGQAVAGQVPQAVHQNAQEDPLTDPRIQSGGAKF